ncbi:MAG: hypothetical protein ABR529_11705 [Actinomycetota bacterium]
MRTSTWERPGDRSQRGPRVTRALERLGSPLDVLKRHGYEVTRARNMRCVFHNPDRNPSASIWRASGGELRYHCFVCDIDLDAIDLEARLTRTTTREVILKYGR